MAKRKASSGGGSILYGILAGLLIGLMVAAAVAYYIVKSPSPFVDKASRTPDKPVIQDVQTAPDPNAALGKRDAAAPDNASDQPPADVPTVTQEAPLQQNSPSQLSTGNDDLGALIASLPKATTSSVRPSRPSANTSTNNAANSKDASPKQEIAKAQETLSDSQNGNYLLQVGAFKVLEDVETMRARIIMLGMPVEIQRAEVNGMFVNRVRVGPFSRLDDMNRVRARLGEEKIPAVVVRQ